MSQSTSGTFLETLKFGIVGGSGVIVNFIVLSISLYILGFIEPIALALGILVSMTTNYILNHFWTFESDNDIPKEYVQYVALNLLGILIQYIVALLLEFYFVSVNFEYLNLIFFDLDTIFIASGIGIGIGFVSNFLFSKYLVFTS